jgi:DNA-binding LacI/PurR family transcriptional regulator
MRPTIRDIAQKINLLITMVSGALDGYDDAVVRARKLVIETAHLMGYAPTRAAHQFRRQQTDAIGYIILFNSSSFAASIFSEFMVGLIF